MTKPKAGGPPPDEGVRLHAPSFARAAEIGSYDPADNSVELIWTTGAAVRRRDWRSGEYYSEILIVTPEAVDLSRLNAGAPLLDTHNDGSVRTVIGSVVPGSARIEGGKGYARVQLSTAAGDADAVEKIRTGIVRNVSVGYSLTRVQVIEKDDGDDEWRVIAWQPFELSAVPVGADPGAHFRARSEGEACEFIDLPDGASAARAERRRVETIAELSSELKLEAFGLRHITAGTGIDAFRSALFEHLVSLEAPIVSNTISVDLGGNSHRAEQRASAIEAAIAHRLDPTKPLSPDAREFRGMGLIDMARDVLEANGVNTRGMNRQEIAGAALMKRSGYHTTGDFPTILGNVVNRTLRAGYEAAPQTFRQLVREVSVPDFKEVSRAQLGEAPALEKVNEHGEYPRGTITEGSEKYKIATYGKIIGITRQVIINDDTLSAESRRCSAFRRRSWNRTSFGPRFSAIQTWATALRCSMPPTRTLPRRQRWGSRPSAPCVRLWLSRRA